MNLASFLQSESALMPASSVKKVKAKPEEYHTLTPSLTIDGADRAIEWYTKVLGAKLVNRMGTPDGKGVWHAELRVGDSVLMLNDAAPDMGSEGPKPDAPISYMIHAYVDDVDGLFQRAVAAGAKERTAPMDMFWGDRYAQIVDPFGHVWSLATHVEDVPRDQMETRGREFAARMASSSHRPPGSERS
jgi:PhnB protein